MVCHPVVVWLRRRTHADSSRAPSYFSQFFARQLQESEEDPGAIRTLYIDRDPVTFQDISRHLQGYHIIPRDGGHYVKLFADAQFYGCKYCCSRSYVAVRRY